MIAEAVKRSILAEYVDRFAALTAARQAALAIRELAFLTQFNLRADLSDPGRREAFRQALGVPLPVEPNTVSSGDAQRALWLGPDEWLVVAAQGRQADTERALRSGLGLEFGSVVDVSANRTVLEVRGPSARDLLAHGCSLDLHPLVFAPGRCAQTLLAKAQVIIERPSDTEDEARFLLYVRSSFAGYLADWLLDAAQV